MLMRGDRVLVALSGGPDSVALLAALAALARRYGIELHAAHLNHGLRGKESQRDQQWAEVVAQRFGVSCAIGQSAALAGTPNLEARARDERYAFLKRVAAEQGCTKIATGHTLDDQAETVLMRLLRGTGWDGLAGIRAVRDGRIIRPLIECARAQVLAFLTACALPFCEDSSNQDRRFLRNRVRHEIIPLLQSLNPQATRNLASAADNVAQEAGLLEDRVRAILGAAPSRDGTLSVAAVVAAPPALRPRVVRTWLREQRGNLRCLTAVHVRAVVDLARGRRPNGRIRLPGSQLVRREYGQLRWRPGEAVIAVEDGRMLVPGAAVCLESGWRIRAEFVGAPGSNWQRPADLWELVADGEGIAAPLVVRTPRPGDHIRPLGLRGHRKLQDIFVDRKIPLQARRSCPVVECNGEILWVPGVVRSQRALITPATRTALRLVADKIGVAGT